MSNTVSGKLDLENRILELEQVQIQQMAELKSGAADIVDSISPSNLIKSALVDVARSPDLRNSAINTAIGIGAGYLGRKIYVGNSKSIFKKIAGSAVQFCIANFVRKKIPRIKEVHLKYKEEN